MPTPSLFRRLTTAFRRPPMPPVRKRVSPLGNILERLEDRVVPAFTHPLNDANPVGVFGLGGVANHTRGWRFQANADVDVQELGAANPIPLGSTYSIALWNFSTTTQLARVDFISDGTDNWQWQTLATPVHLTSGQQYIVTQFSTAANYYFGTAPSSWRPTGTIQYLDMRYANSATVNTFPTSVLSGYQYGIPDIGYGDLAPTITSVTSTTADGTYGAGATINVTVNFSEPTTLAGGNLTVNLDTGGSVTITPFSNATSASGTYTVAAGESSLDLNSNSPLVLGAGATLRDSGGNDATLTIPSGQSLADLKAIVIDTIPPDTMIDPPLPANPTNDNTPTFTFSGTDDIGVASFEVSLDGGAFAAGSSPFTTSTLSDGSHTFAVRAVDAAGNVDPTPASYTFTVDTLAPTVTSIDDGDADNAVAVGTTLVYTVTFDEDIDATTVSSADFNNAGTASITLGTITETSPGVFTVQVTPTTAGTLILRIPTGAVISDVAGNNLVVPVQDNDTITVNVPPPPAQQYDFQPSAGSPLQAGAIAVLPGTGYTAALGYGWTKTPWRTTDAGPLPSLAGNPLAFQLRDYMSDFGGLSSAGIFRVDLPTADPVQITTFLGDASGALDGIEVAFSTNGTTYTPFTPGGGLTIAAGKFTSVTSPAVIPGVVGETRSVWIRIQDLAGSTSNWSASGLAVRTVGSVGALNVTPSEGSVPADGTTVDTYTVTGAAPGAVLNISASLGTILTDARTELLGNQVIADGTGMATFQVRRPFVNGNSTITVSDFTGAAAATATQNYSLMTTRKFDMNAGTASLPDASWLDVRTTSLYSAAAGYGWTTAPTAADLGTYPAGSTVPQQGLYRDYHSGTGTNTFKVYVGAFCNVNVKIYTYTPSLGISGMTVSLEGGAFQPVSGTSTTFVATAGADGILDITFKAAMFANWATNGIEVF